MGVINQNRMFDVKLTLRLIPKLKETKLPYGGDGGPKSAVTDESGKDMRPSIQAVSGHNACYGEITAQERPHRM